VKTDIWALGCTLFKLLFREDLYKSEERLPILNGKVRTPQGADEQLMSVIKIILNVDPVKRPFAFQIVRQIEKIMSPNIEEKIELPNEPIPKQEEQESIDSSSQAKTELLDNSYQQENQS
jgi:serine/threonine protein kinase